MTDSVPRPINPHFVADLRRALNHLYDPDELRRNPLFAALGTLARGSPSLLREAFIQSISELKPRAGLSPDSDAWRVYRTLHHRFVEQFTQAEAAATLGVSIRQVRRQESQALRVLADLLWTRYPLQALYPDVSEQGAEEELEDEEPPAPGRNAAGGEAEPPNTSEGGKSLAQELAWLGQSLPSAAVTLPELVDSALRTAEPVLHELAVEVRSRMPEDLPSVVVQAGPIRQALLLVLVEAIRLAPGGEVLLEACAEPNQVTLTVRSLASHPAPARAALDKLAVARQIAELSGSQLETIIVASDVPFVASDVPFVASDVPFVASDVPFVAHLHLRAAPQATILFIEDNPDMLQLYQRYLAGTGYHFASAATDGQIVASLAEVVPQIIILDVMLSGMDGWEVLGRLRTHPRTQEVPVVMCSILPLEQLALNLGAAAFLQKPVSREALLATLNHLREVRGRKPCSTS
ncbi:MAG: response regulator [Anaerolineae bacterium]|jgi:CheY-like chemotaxis protein|nr:response regulator [Anaerolineae bacterium]